MKDAEDRADDRAYLSRRVEMAKVKATREQTAEMRKLRETLGLLLSALDGTPSEDA